MRRMDEAGGATVLFGLTSAVLVAAVAFSVDLGRGYMILSRLQIAADSGALAAAQIVIAKPDEAPQRGVDFVQKNAAAEDGTLADVQDVVAGNYDTTSRIFSESGSPKNAVKATVRRSPERGNAYVPAFGSFMGITEVEIEAAAIALGNYPARCVYALAGSGSKTFHATGNGGISVPNCGIQVNSTDSGALQTNGNAQISAREICVKGGYSGSNITPTPTTNCDLSPDPLASVPEPTMPSTCYMTDATITSDTTVLPDKRYCGMTTVGSSATVTFPSGIYYFDNLKVTNSGTLVSDKAMIYMGAGGVFNFTSSGDLILDAPEDGTYRGIAIFGARSGAVTGWKISGTRNVTLGGSVYAPKANIEATGDSTVQSDIPMGFVIANSFKYSGNATLTLSMGSKQGPAGLSPTASLVE